MIVNFEWKGLRIDSSHKKTCNCAGFFNLICDYANFAKTSKKPSF